MTLQEAKASLLLWEALGPETKAALEQWMEENAEMIDLEVPPEPDPLKEAA